MASVIESTRHRIESEWSELRTAPPGRRFEQAHERMRARGPAWAKPLHLVAAALSFAVGVVLVFVPGPAVLFFALAAALLARQSAWFAKRLDAAELVVRHWIQSVKRWRASARR